MLLTALHFLEKKPNVSSVLSPILMQGTSWIIIISVTTQSGGSFGEGGEEGCSGTLGPSTPPPPWWTWSNMVVTMHHDTSTWIQRARLFADIRKDRPLLLDCGQHPKKPLNQWCDCHELLGERGMIPIGHHSILKLLKSGNHLYSYLLEGWWKGS